MSTVLAASTLLAASHQVRRIRARRSARAPAALKGHFGGKRPRLNGLSDVADGLHRYGADNIMSPDDSHLAAIFPRSHQFTERTFGSVPAAQKRQIVQDTAARIYGIDD